MKTTIYNLLGMIKDNKAPKNIIYDGVVFNFDTEDKDYYDEKYGNLFEYLFNNVQTDAFLNNEVKILNEPKKDKIEKLDIQKLYNRNYFDKESTIDWLKADITTISKTINELIDKINKDNNER